MSKDEQENTCPFKCLDGVVTPKINEFRATPHPEAIGRKIVCPIHGKVGQPIKLGS